MAGIDGLTSYLTFVIFTAVLGMFQFGYNTGVINSPQENIERFIREVYKGRNGEEMGKEEATRLFSVAVSLFAIGGMLGGFSGGVVADKLGRKRGMWFNNILGLLGAGFMGFAEGAGSYEMLFVGRFLIGVNCGLNTSLCPLYVSEIAPVNLRGGLGTVNQLGVATGLVLSQVLGIETVLGSDSTWHVLLLLSGVGSILQGIFLPFCPESPRYLLITKQDEDTARTALIKLRATNQIEDFLEEMRQEERAERSETKITMKQLIFSPTLRAPLIVGIVLHLSQQFSGINAVFYYSTSIFKDSGLSEDSAKTATIGIGVIMVVMTLISIPLMDKAGRRTLHLYGLAGMFVFSIILTISLSQDVSWVSYISVASTFLYVMSFAIGPGSIPWMIVSELFSQGPRPAAVSIAVLINWLANFIVGIGFPSMQDALKQYSFIPFTILLAIFWIFTYAKVPETKNRTFEEIAALFRSDGEDNRRIVDT